MCDGHWALFSTAASELNADDNLLARIKSTAEHPETHFSPAGDSGWLVRN